MHSHRCKKCGCVWHHSSEMRGNTDAHKCPQCGSAEWQQFEHQSQPLPLTMGRVTLGHGTGVPYQSPVYAAPRRAIDIALDVVTWGAIAVLAGVVIFQVYKMYREGGFKIEVPQ